MTRNMGRSDFVRKCMLTGDISTRDLYLDPDPGAHDPTEGKEIMFTKEDGNESILRGQGAIIGTDILITQRDIPSSEVDYDILVILITIADMVELGRLHLMGALMFVDTEGIGIWMRNYTRKGVATLRIETDTKNLQPLGQAHELQQVNHQLS
jgi:hypothetical protein